MKHIPLLLAVAAFAAANVTNFAAPMKFGPVNFKLSSIQEDVDVQSTASTNRTSSSTNITLTSLHKTQTTTINNHQLLNMLANSFNTNWPSGAELKVDSSGDFDVVTGSTLVEDVSTVLSFSASTNAVDSGTVVYKYTINSSGESETETDKYTQTEWASPVYDDSNLATANGNTTRITVTGIQTTRAMVSISNSGETSNYVVSFTGTGTGSVSNATSDNLLIVGGTVTDTSSSP